MIAFRKRHQDLVDQFAQNVSKRVSVLEGSRRHKTNAIAAFEITEIHPLDAQLVLNNFPEEIFEESDSYVMNLVDIAPRLFEGEANEPRSERTWRRKEFEAVSLRVISALLGYRQDPALRVHHCA